MSVWGIVPPQDWDRLKTGSRADDVPAGDYFAQLNEVRVIEPRGEKNLGAYILTYVTTDENPDAQWRGKTLESRISFHPDPKEDNYQTMNDISAGKIIQVIEAANAEPISMPDGSGFNIIETLKALPTAHPKMKVTVSKRTDKGRTYQDVDGFRGMAQV